MEKQNKIQTLIKIFWIFILGCIIGFIVETFVAFVQEGQLASRKGLIYGPFTPVYGVGILIYYFFIPKIKNKKMIFFYSMIIGGITEYLCSYLQEQCFGTVSWDYQNLWFNIHGRTSLLHCTYWGIAGVLFDKFVYPLCQKLDQYVIKTKFQYITMIFLIFMLFNISISCLAANRQEERIKAIQPQGKIDQFLDVYYPDTRMNKIYANKLRKR